LSSAFIGFFLGRISIIGILRLEWRMFLSHVGSLPIYEGLGEHPYSHIDHWLKIQTQLGFDLVGTGEPGGHNRYRMIERFTQDIRGFEVRRLGNEYKTYRSGKIAPPEDADEVKEVVENRYLRKIAGKEIKLKATVTDPVTIVCGLGNFIDTYRDYPNVFWDLTDALKPFVEALEKIVDIIQFDCPIHSYNPTRDPWQYIDELTKHVKVSKWIHICGPLKNVFLNLASKNAYKVDVVHCHLFGREEEENFKAIEENAPEFRRSGKKLGAGVINTAISDVASQVDSAEKVTSRIERLQEILGKENIAAIGPGCGLALLPQTAPIILERAAEVSKAIEIK